MADYKDTLLLPKTEFSMRGNLARREPLFQEEWEKIDLYNSVLRKNDKKPFYVLHDGPPYANGDIHTGHALNKILKDFIVRYKNMSGFKSPYIPGWDTHGLPIETAITKKGVNRKEMTINDFRKSCHKYALEQVEKQKGQFKRLGVLGEFNNPYITLEKYFEAEQIRVFAKMAKKGLIYKGLKPIYWSPSSESALAEAEIEYHDRKDPSIYVSFDIVEGKKVYDGAKLVIWTTTPWTLPGNLAVCVGPKIDYVLVKVNNDRLIVANDLLNSLKEELEFKNIEIIETFKGKELLGVTYKHPLYDRVSPVITGDHVTTTDGTGLVHTAPGHGEDDFNVGKLFDLEILCPVDGKGIMTEEAGQYKGLSYDQANKKITEDLDSKGHLLKLKFITHSYPHDWRTKKPIIFRATPQWFASIEKMKKNLLKEISNVKWYPKWGEIRISNMIKDRKEWCISRQRAWGVPIPIFYAEDDKPILDQEIFEHIANLFAKHGSDIWFEKDAAELLPKGYKNQHSPNNIFRKETDIMDVWFDSGSSHQAVLKHYNLPYPADMYLEGSDQYRGWFNSSLITGVSVTDKAPYKEVITHGFVLDGNGRKMSKSLGNAIDPIKVINQKGADILRLWCASVEYNSDVRISEDMLKQVSEVYRKIRNTTKFLLGNLSDFSKKNILPMEKLNDVDKYMMIKINDLVREVKKSYENYAFNDVYRLINNFISTLLSPFYLDFTKDILYIEKADSHIRRSVQTVLYEITLSLFKILTPILPHTMSEAYKAFPFQEAEDVYMLDMPEVKDYDIYKNIKNDFDQFLIFRDEILKELEQARENKIIGKSLNAKLIIYPDEETDKMIKRINANIMQLCIVSELEIKNIVKKKRIVIEAAKGHVCERCWLVVKEVTNGICDRCSTVIK